MDLKGEANYRRWSWWQTIKKDKIKLQRIAAACAT